ncbi:hypothetical protein VHEMI02600 [[Torrubiella] hemipterigena]|uniref:BZIP domain-containing protein n=1 Tax=[Torrubiella] hemipterigena TaxID=1531966 RepID=A0A0A1SW93_9HYPO|nr:hypothetical protein VHEMI02600 [[Torrubiella] hemipterigena]
MSQNSTSSRVSASSSSKSQKQKANISHRPPTTSAMPDTTLAESYGMAGQGYNYDAFSSDSSNLALYMNDPNYAVPTTQMNWPTMDASSYQANDSYADSIGSFTDPNFPHSPIEIEVIGKTGAKKTRSRPNRYKNAHPSVKERRREQNREAQRKYRERKDQRIVELEGLLQTAQHQHQTLTQAYVDLHAEYEILLRQTTQSPSEVHTDEDLGEGSIHGGRV